MKKIHILFAVGLLVCANLYASNTKDVVTKKCGKGHKECGKRLKEYDKRVKEYGKGHKECGKRLKEYDKRVKEYDKGHKECGKRPKECGKRLKEYDKRHKECGKGPKECGKRLKEYGKRPKECGKRPKIAIMPIKSQMVDYCSSGLKLSPEKLVSLFSQRLTTRLIQTHKFAVLVEELGADYLLVGEISKAKLKKKEKFLKTANCTITKYKAKFVFNYQLISSLTKEIILADVAVAKYQSMQVSPGRQPKRMREISIITNNINDVVERIIDQLCSMRVVSVKQDGTVIISQGTDKISEGMWLDIFSRGEEFFDCDAKKSLGKDEKLIAKVKVKRVKPKIIYAKIICGDVSKISKGLICRVGKAKKYRRLPFLIR